MHFSSLRRRSQARPRRVPLPRWPRRQALTGLLTLVAAAESASAADGNGAGLGPWLLGCSALAVVVLAAAAGMSFGSLRSERRSAAALRDSQRDARQFTQLFDGWSWQTDATHRVRQWQPPASAPAGAWAGSSPLGQAFWDACEVTDTADVAGLRARLESQQPLIDLPVQQTGSGTGWRLRAAPRFDDTGRFMGYTGTARPTDADDARHAERLALDALVDALVDALPGPALVATRAGTQGWKLRHANTEALQGLQGDAPATTLTWDDVLARLPAPLRQAIVAPPGAATSAMPDDWRVKHLPGADGASGALLVSRPPRAAAATDDAASDTRSESESFGFTVSHDLRAPIRVVEGFTRILKEDYGRQLDRVGNDHLDRVLGAAARMNHMIDALLTLARLSSQPLAQQPVNLSQLAGYVVDDLRRAAPERSVDVEIEAGMQVGGDPTLLRLVLENLLGNAWKYSARVQRARIAFGTELQAGRRVFVVRDNGAGFDMRSSDRLFGLFQRLHSSTDFPGTGVGLASVKRIVRRHGGEIWAEAEPGRGAAFHFTLRG